MASDVSHAKQASRAASRASGISYLNTMLRAACPAFGSMYTVTPRQTAARHAVVRLASTRGVLAETLPLEQKRHPAGLCRFIIALLMLLTTVTLYSTLIPISLYVSIELIKYLQVRLGLASLNNAAAACMQVTAKMPHRNCLCNIMAARQEQPRALYVSRTQVHNRPPEQSTAAAMILAAMLLLTIACQQGRV